MAEWQSWGSTPDATISVDGLSPHHDFEVQVRAISANGVPSDWYSMGTIEVDEDTTPPPMPSLPTLTTELGTVTVTWDGLTADAQQMPADFAHVVVEQQGVGDVDILNVPGYPIFSVITGLTAGETYNFRLIAVDHDGNASTPTAYVPVTVSSILDDPDLEGAIIDKVQTEIVNSGRNRLIYSELDPSVDGKEVVGDTWYKRSGNDIIGQWEWDGDSYEPKLLSHEAIGSLDAGKITVGRLDGGIINAASIGADKLVVGASSNLVIDPRFQNDDINEVRALTRRQPEFVSIDKVNQRIVLQPGFHWVDDPSQSQIILATTPYNPTAATAVDRQPDLSNYIQVEPGQKVIITIRMENAGSARAGLVLGFMRRGKSGEWLSNVAGDPYEHPDGTDDVPPGATVSYSYTYTVPGGASATYYLMPLIVAVNQATSTGPVYVYDPQVYNQVSGVRIADGAITAQNLAVGAVTANSISVGALDGKIITGSTVRTAATGNRVEMNGSNLIIGDRPSSTTGTGWIFYGATGYANVRGVAGGQLFTVNPDTNKVTLGTTTGFVEYDDATKILSVKGAMYTGTVYNSPIDGTISGTGAHFRTDGVSFILKGGDPWITFDAALTTGGGRTTFHDHTIYLEDSDVRTSLTDTGPRITWKVRSTDYPRIEVFDSTNALTFGAYSTYTGTYFPEFVKLNGVGVQVSSEKGIIFREGTLSRGMIYESGDNLVIQSNYSLVLDCGASGGGGNVAVPSAYTSAYGGTVRDVHASANGSLVYPSSSRSVKVNIDTPEIDLDSYLSLDVRSWNWKQHVERYADLLDRKAQGEEVDEAAELAEIEMGGGLEKGYGLIAEEVEEAGFPEYVVHDDDGTVMSLDYKHLWLPLLPIAKQHHSELRELREELATIKAQLASLTNGLTP